MIVDTSALVAVLLGEPRAGELEEALAAAPVVRISAGTLLEVGVVVDRLGDPVLGHRLDQLLAAVGADVVPLGAEHARTGRQAYRDFGKGTGHPARLNLGDCFAYALAHETGETLLFVGDDFTHTDVEPALP